MISVHEQGQLVAAAARAIANASDEVRRGVLRQVAQSLRAQQEAILVANQADLDEYVDLSLIHI